MSQLFFREIHSRPHQMTDIQYNTIIMGGREVSRPYRVDFSPRRTVFFH